MPSKQERKQTHHQMPIKISENENLERCNTLRARIRNEDIRNIYEIQNSHKTGQNQKTSMERPMQT
jgi:hypothetical protein